MKTRAGSVGMVIALLLLVAACGGGAEPPASAVADGQLSGAIEADGSSTVEPLSLAIAEEFRAEAPDVTVNVGRSGTGGGFERFCAGETDISNASRPIDADEQAACEAAGISYTELQVGTDALTVVTNAATDWTDCLTIDQMRTIFQSGGAASWSQVDPAFPDTPITIFAPDADSGTYDFFLESVELEESRQDYTASADDNQLVTGIEGTQGSWGFFGFAFYQENSDQLKALGIDAGGGCVSPSVETAQDGSYPLTRPLFIYVRNDALQRPEVAGFVTFYLETVNSLIEEVGYVPLPDDLLATEVSDLEAGLGS